MAKSQSIEPAASLPPARLAHRYEVKDRIAAGGMGAVYRAFDRVTGEEVALKRVLLDDPSMSALFVAAFEREYQVLASLDHPRIIRVFDYGVDAEGPYYTMELVRGRDLSKAAPLPWRDACRYLRDVATSLALLHARSLLHRDLSPSNVKLDADDRAKLLDFGALADFGVNQWVVGTPPMIPPEVLRGEALDQRADLYALGALGYWALTGRHAFPASKLDQLHDYWERPLPPPSAQAPDVPRALDQLLLSLLSRDPLARPASAAQVMTRLQVIAQLSDESEHDRRRIAQSFLTEPPFVGRDAELVMLSEQLAAAVRGHGASIRVEALAGSGRTRLLDEIGVRAKLSGATVLRVDASMHPNHQGTVRALAMRLLDALPDLAREHAERHVAIISMLGREVQLRLSRVSSRPPRSALTQPPRITASEPRTDPGSELSDWLFDVSRHKPLVVEVDNIESCDPASLGMLASLSSRLRSEALLLVITERLRRVQVEHKALAVLRGHSRTLTLVNLTPAETLELARSLFGDVPGVERFADWLHSNSAGSPLHCVEITRQLIAQDVIRHEGGLWLLPGGRPQLELPEALEDALSVRIGNLSERALGLAQSLSLQRGEPTVALCALLAESEQEALGLLDELARNDVLYSNPSGYRFASAALRDALLRSMNTHETLLAHAKLGRVFESLADGEPEQQMEAGWHYMRGGMELRGADLVASVIGGVDPNQSLLARGYRMAPMAEAALAIYKRHRRSPYARMPLITALGSATYFEDYLLTPRYADEALDVADDLGGLRTVRRLRRFIGVYPALLVSLLVTWLRFVITPRVDRPYSFVHLIRSTLMVMVPLVGAKSMALDADRADAIASALSPFAGLPARTTFRGIYELCMGFQQIGRDRQAKTFETFDELSKRYADPAWYPALPPDLRRLLRTATHFARGSFAVFRADSQLALDDARAMDHDVLKMYSTAASQLRALYHMFRGEFSEAAHHRAQVDVYAAQVGSAWNVELWEPAALLPVYISTGDVVGLAHCVRRLEELVRVEPCLEFYRQLAELALTLVRHEGVEERLVKQVEQARAMVEQYVPRSFIGWSATIGVVASAYNRLHKYREARDVCESALVLTTDADRQYVTLFLETDLQAAIADAGLGQLDAALARIDGLLARFTPSGHPLALGRLHETRATISHAAGRLSEYRHHLARMEHWFRPTGTPVLIAKCERVADLEPLPDTSRHRLPDELGERAMDSAATEVTRRR